MVCNAGGSAKSETVIRFVVAIHVHLHGVMFPARHMLVSIINPLTQDVASAVLCKGICISNNSLASNGDTTDCNELPVPEALRTGNLDIPKSTHFRW